jgi:hypothetical protein
MSGTLATVFAPCEIERAYNNAQHERRPSKTRKLTDSLVVEQLSDVELSGFGPCSWRDKLTLFSGDMGLGKS